MTDDTRELDIELGFTETASVPPTNGHASTNGDSDLRAAELELLRSWLDLPSLTRVIKRGAKGEAYDLELDERTTINLGSIYKVENYKHVRATIAGVTDILPPRRTAEKAEPVLALLLKLAELHDVTATEREETSEWLAEYLPRSRGVFDTTDREQLAAALNTTDPFRDTDGRWHLRLTSLRTFVNRECDARVTGPELSTRLGRLGFERRQLSLRDGDQVLKGRYYISPPNWDADR